MLKIHKKICHIQFAYYPGQGNTDIYEYTKSLAELEQDVYAIVAGRKNEKQKNIVNGVKVKRIFINFKNQTTVQSLKFYLVLIKNSRDYIKTNNFDIVHVYSSFGCFLLPLFIKHKGKWIYDIRSGAIGGKIKGICSKIIQRFEALFFDAVITLDEALGNSIFNKNKRNLYIVPLGANLEVFRQLKSKNIRDRYNIKKDEYLLLYIGAIHKKRRLTDIITAFKKVIKEKDKIKLMLVGGGPALSELKGTVNQLNLGNQIIFTGQIRYDEIPRYINSADIGLSYIPITKEYNLQPPLKTVEYMACELPTIATNTLGNRRFIKHKFNGLLIKDNPSDLAKSIVTMIDNEKLRKKIAKNSRNSIKHYHWTTIVKEKLLPIYLTVSNR